MKQEATLHPTRCRSFEGADDFWRVRDLLVEAYPRTPLGWNWDVRLWEGRWFYAENPVLDPKWTSKIGLWETAEGRLVGVVCTEGGEAEAHLQLDPAYRHLEAEMIAWSEAHLAQPPREGAPPEIACFSLEMDATRIQVLRQRGYAQVDDHWIIRRISLDGPLPARRTLPAGYALRTTRPDDPTDCLRIADILNAAFGRDFHNGAEYHNFTRLAPSYVNDLDLVAVAPNGSFAAYVGIPYEATNRRGIYEPVCTHPAHRRKGLARALMTEGLHRLAARGAQTVTVETGNAVPANGLYDAMGFTESVVGHLWKKAL